MKYVILSEGKRDVKLVKTYYSTKPEDIRITTFYGEDVTHSRLKNQESQQFRNFLEPRNPYDVLAKSENGKPNLKLLFTKLVYFILQSDVELILIFDLDGADDDSGIIRDLDQRVRTNYQGRSFSIAQRGIIDSSSDQMLTENILLQDDRVIDEFHILSFYSNLEQSVGIKSTDSAETEEEKLKEFVEDDVRSSPMRKVL